jgi:hypothetical protein
MSNATSFTALVNDPAFTKHEREAREREAREQHERRVRRGSHEPSAGSRPSPADLRDSITRDRRRDVDTGKPLHFESEMRAQQHRSRPVSGGRAKATGAGHDQR